MQTERYYFSSHDDQKRLFGAWDFLIFIVIVACLFLFSWAGRQMATPYQLGSPISIQLAPSFLPAYALRTVLRMFIALGFSLLFTFIFGTWAAKSQRAAKIIIPSIDILQSIPVLSFLSITIVGFIQLFPSSMLGPECASIFAIFTAQAWNMALGFYQSLKTIPSELVEAARMFRLSSWQRFWKLEVPYSMSSLLWNMMMSMSASWFFVVLSEAISVANQDIRLPGLGSYIALAIESANGKALLYAILAMLVVILLYDQLLFRPLIAWSEKFKVQETPGEVSYQSWFANILRRSRMVSYINHGFDLLSDWWLHCRIFNVFDFNARAVKSLKYQKFQSDLWYMLTTFTIVASSIWLMHFILSQLPLTEIIHVFLLGLATSARVIFCIIVSSLLWVPVGVYIGRHPKLTKVLQPIIQMLAAFPANLIYPVVILLIVKLRVNVEIGVIPLMILGTQWYILFNVIAGAARVPRELYLAAANFEVKGWLWWKRLALPGIFPYYITGAMTAAGGAWNASIVAEWASWGHTTLKATGLGEYIHAFTNAGQFPQIALGTSVMCIYVLAFNYFLWRPLYQLAESRYSLQ